LDGCIRFDEIPRIIERVLAATKTCQLESIKQVLQADAEARRVAGEHVEQLSGNTSPNAAGHFRNLAKGVI